MASGLEISMRVGAILPIEGKDCARRVVELPKSSSGTTNGRCYADDLILSYLILSALT